MTQNRKQSVSERYNENATVVLQEGEALKVLKDLPNDFVKLIITSPPYNIGKEYEKKVDLRSYLSDLKPICQELKRVLHPEGSICWQVGNFVDNGEIYPLDIQFYPLFKKLGFKLRNRIIWHFDHGLHTSRRFSGRYETILWFTKGNNYTFNLDPVRVPAKYPGKRHYKEGPNYGKPSGNPLGKNPADIWKIVIQDWESSLWDIPNVKANHPEKTIHVCQFPIELVERCVLALTNENDWVMDPFAGVGSAVVGAIKCDRRGFGIDREAKYLAVAQDRVTSLWAGSLPYRPLGKTIYKPTGSERVAQIPEEWRTNTQDTTVRKLEIK